MESSSDGMKKRIQHARMKQPPLIKQLRAILAEYPDGGQILKELIQNAEDAGATNVNILYDGRNINNDISEDIPAYTKFFKGPALCVYNNAVFTETDWAGIQMIYSSVKEEDPLKVGRFGLGFKSVFHITDYPCIISGDRLLLMDPQQPQDSVNATLVLSALEDYKDEGVDADAFWRTFEGIFELYRSSLDQTGYQGTLFWFPLRENKSELSETLYTETKVKDLFDSFQSEASNVLIFLKNVQHITLCVRDSDAPIRDVLVAKIDDANSNVRQSRDKFKQRINGFKSPYDGEDIHCSMQMTIHTSTPERDENMEWLVVNYFVGESASSDFRSLISDTNLGYSPYVGVAAPLGETPDEFEGHVFCFLPLPREGERLTGLPVHVNGFFALSQNRHHMKWETNEQEGKKIDDKSILWNKALIEEALPKAYELLVLEAIKLAEAESARERSVLSVYRMMPLYKNGSRNAHKRWTGLENNLYKRLATRNIMYATHTCEWIAIQEACFATFNSLPVTGEHIQSVVTKCLRSIGLKYVDLPEGLFETLQKHLGDIQDLSPKSLSVFLQERGEYRNLSNADKLDVLSYLLSDDDNTKNIRNLELLPVASERWKTFNKSSDTIFLCSEDGSIKMFPGLEDRLVLGSEKLTEQLNQYIERISKSGIYQIERLTIDCAKNMLKQTMRNHIGSDSCVRLTNKTSLNSEWLHDVWHVLTDKKCLIKHFKDIPLVPILLEGTWSNPHVLELARLTDLLILKEAQVNILTIGLISALEAMTIKVIPSLPDWISEDSVQEFIYRPTKSSVVSLLGTVYKRVGKTAISEFNRLTERNNQMTDAMIEFISGLTHIEMDVVALLKHLNIFKTVRSMEDEGQCASVSTVHRFILESVHFPNGVLLPFDCIKVGRSEEMVIKHLDAEMISQETLILKTIENLMTKADHEQITVFMKYFLDTFHVFEGNRNICLAASKLTFLTAGTQWCKPSELFDPSDASLQSLFLGESVFPDAAQTYGREELRILRCLGMKGKDALSAGVLLQVANTVDRWSKDDHYHDEIAQKADELMKVLHQQPGLLDEYCNNSIATLSQHLTSLACIPVKRKMPSDYPVGLPWYSEGHLVCKPVEAKYVDLSLLAGAVMPIVECVSDNMIQRFRWNTAPNMETVIQQLSSVRKHYTVHHKPDYMRAIQRIYKHMSQCPNEISRMKTTLANEEVVWTDCGFNVPGKIVVTQNKHDLDLKPYYFNIPEEFGDMANMFLHLGCHQKQEHSILLSALQNVQHSHQSTEMMSCHVSRDTTIVLEVLRVLSERRTETSIRNEIEILMLVENESSESLSLRPVSNCIFDDDQGQLDVEEERNLSIVHASVPFAVATALGVKSVKAKTMMNAAEEFSFEDWGQSESLTNRISTLLRDGYTDGLSVPKELVQNADDAGASVVKFLYDERYNDSARRKQKLFSSELAECQGPAMWVYNNSKFTEKDLESITKLNGATKADSEDKIGKFGLGFCSVYNLTDVPSFISGNDMVIFDPHETYLEEARQRRGTGLRIKLTKRNVIRRNIDQFKPYSGVFDCTLLDPSFTEFQGTLFRLPLRTAEQAEKSDICKEAYPKSEVKALLKKLVENAGNLLLFTQYVKTLEIYHLPKEETDPSQAKLLFSIDKETELLTEITDTSGTSNAIQSVLRRMPSILSQNEQFRELHRIKLTQCVIESPDMAIAYPTVPNSMVSYWINSWALGEGESLTLSKRILDKGAVPLSSISVPIHGEDNSDPVLLKDVQSGFYSEGHVFCFLPLPIATGLPLHINGCFSVTSDRRGLMCFTEDDKRKGDFYRFNYVLMEDSLVQAFMQLLLFLSRNSSDSYRYHTLWPLNESENIRSFKQGFYRALLRDSPKLFRGVREWFSVDEVVFLDPIMSNTKIGETAFELICTLPPRPNKRVIELPHEVLTVLKESNCDMKAVLEDATISEEELLIHFLHTIHESFWDCKQEKRNELLLRALNHSSNRVSSKLRDTQCIPSDPHGILCRPDELLDPRSELAHMFYVDDGRFPMTSSGFSGNSVFDRLIVLGMNDKYLPKPVLIDRCESIGLLGTTCSTCAKDRCIAVLKYLSKCHILQILEEDTGTVLKLRNMPLFPVLTRPHSWKFSWGADKVPGISTTSKCAAHLNNSEKSIKFEVPSILFRESLLNTIGSIQALVNEGFFRGETSIPEKLLDLLGVQSQMPIPLLVKQLTLLSEQYVNPDQQYRNLEIIYRSVIQCIAGYLGDTSEDEIADITCLKGLESHPVVLIGKDLVRPCQAAFSINYECPPELYHLSEVVFNRKQVFMALGVSDYISVRTITAILHRIQRKWEHYVCTDITTVANILRNLCDSMTREKIEYEDNEFNKDNIVAPDSDGYLRHTCELVIEDPEYRSTISLYTLHGSISPDTGRMIGVKSKQKKIVEGFSSQFCIPFGQNENLVTRLNGILEDYPCDSSIMKELIQNADDAGASEIHFIKNYETYEANNVFGKGEIQGPSLCVYNNSYFTDDDFDGIRNLGVGSKREDPSKTGRYGVGFNAVYHLTDIPSFITKGPDLGVQGQMCIFDPMMEHIGEFITRENPGIRCDIEKMNSSYPGLLLGFSDMQSLFHSEQGTLFRLPLRQKPSKISKHVVTLSKMDTLVTEFTEGMFESLLFLKNIQSIKVSRVSDGKLIEEYSVCTNLSSENTVKCKTYFDQVKGVVVKNKSCQNDNLAMKPIEAAYSVDVTDSKGKEETWYVVNRFGIETVDESYNDVINAFRDKHLGLLPTASVAMRLPSVKSITHCKQSKTSYVRQEDVSRKRTSGRAFCILPLPILTGLPLHVNGHFALDRARRELWKEGIRNRWNEFVLAELVSRAWITAVEFMKIYLVQAHVNEMSVKIVRLTIMDMYHDIFPRIDNAVDEIWKTPIKRFYQIVVSNRVCLFPSIHCKQPVQLEQKATSSGEHISAFSVLWVPLSISETEFSGMFNCIFIHASDFSGGMFGHGRSSCSLKDGQNVEQVLKEMGMMLLETPKEIRRSVEQSDIKYIPTCNPKSVLCFLKTYNNSDALCCKLGNIEGPLTETTIHSVDILRSILKFVMLDEHFEQHLDGLPLCLTNDGILRLFSRQTPVFCSSMCDVLTGSSSQFASSCFVGLNERKEFHTAGVLKRFEIDNLLALFSETFDPAVFATEHQLMWYKDANEPVKLEHLTKIYSYIYNQSIVLNKTGPHVSTHVSHPLFQANLKKFVKWTILPCSNKHGSRNTYKLIPLSQKHHVLYCSYGNPQVNDIIAKFNILSLDSSAFGNYDLEYAVQNTLPSTARPVELLRCFLHYKSKISSCGLTPDEGIILMSYFNGRITEMTDQIGSPELRRQLEMLPLFVSHQHELINIADYQNAIVLPSGIPTAGIDSWASSTRIALLLQTDMLKNLYSFLSLSLKTGVKVYNEKILPNINELPRENWLAHITYIRDTVLVTSAAQEYDADQQELIQTLKCLAFVNVSGVSRQITELYHAKHPVFKHMVNDDLFLPTEFDCPAWLKFMQLLGLIMKPTDEMMITFALQIENNRNAHISETTKQQSLALTKCLFSGDWNEQTLGRIKGIRFVVPYSVSDFSRDIFRQPSDARVLICLEGSISMRFERDCWTALDLLTVIPGDSKIQSLLGIHNEPPVASVVKHCQNISDVLKRRLKERNISPEFVKDQMNIIYYRLSNNYEQNMKQKLQCTPLVYIPNENEMVCVHEIVVNLAADEVVPPYLYKLPNCFGQFETLFCDLGSDTNVSSQHYARVLEAIKNEFRDEPIIGNTLLPVKTAIENIVHLLNKGDTTLEKVKYVYLMNKDQVLVKSKTLTVSNNSDIEDRLKGKLGLSYFIGFKELEIKNIPDPAIPFQSYPELLRPDILTDVVSEQASLENISVAESIQAVMIEHAIQSPHFIEGVLRLVKHQLKVKNLKFESTLESRIVTYISSAKITKVIGLKTVLIYNDNIVDGTERDTSCFIERKAPPHSDETKHELLFQIDCEDNLLDKLIDEQHGILQLIDYCTEGILEKELSRMVATILRLIDTPLEIKRKLDKNRIDQYDLPLTSSVSVFPKPGTYVEEKFHPFLEQAIIPFKKREYRYVALEIEDSDDNEEQVFSYIYVHIVSENEVAVRGNSDLDITHQVNYGHHSETLLTVPLDRLYRFKPRDMEEINAVVTYDIEPVGSLSIDENFRRVRQMLIEAWTKDKTARERIIRRLLMRWHPDRNREHSEYATRVFNYVNDTVLKLENGELVVEDITDNTGRVAPDMASSSYGHVASTIYNRGCTYARAFHNNMQDYNRSTHTGAFAYGQAENGCVRHVGEAKRWYRQAVHDFQAAENNINYAEDDKSFNWVCYKSHQASEKALKAAWFSKNANRATSRGHSVTNIACGLDDGRFLVEAQRLESTLGDYFSMRYPDAVRERRQIPAEAFDRDTAEQALEITKCILELASDFIA